MQLLTGVLFHAVGASCAALCYTPQKKVLNWSWQTYWLAQAFVCWFLLPIVIAWLTIPHLALVMSETPKDVMLKTFGLGAAYGIGGTAFGIAIRYVGFSLTYAISVGISCVLGTLLPPWIKGELASVLEKTGSNWLMFGITMGALGIILCGVAGRYKEIDLQKSKAATSFSLSKGLPVCILAGILSAAYGLSIEYAQPIADVAEKYGAANYKSNVIYIFANTGAFLSTLVYCIYLHDKNNTFKEYFIKNNRQNKSGLSLNFALASLTGLLWYGQFFFYGLGHTRMGNYQFSSWAIHMIMLILFSSITGLVLNEWVKIHPRTTRLLVFGLAVLITAILMLTYGNYLGNK